MLHDLNHELEILLRPTGQRDTTEVRQITNNLQWLNRSFSMGTHNKPEALSDLYFNIFTYKQLMKVNRTCFTQLRHAVQSFPNIKQLLPVMHLDVDGLQLVL